MESCIILHNISFMFLLNLGVSVTRKCPHSMVTHLSVRNLVGLISYTLDTRTYSIEPELVQYMQCTRT